ncbi:MAG: prepilin-type N-terminal cleavage/methylation domain-containing protein [Methylococcaceae bacterium]|nr:prepilin-type N-terminal cleavage/methylation domain-containing protein [Methylococcaceae bacterium]
MNVSLPAHHLMAQRGFTLIELVMVMIIAGILANTALPRFFGISDYKTRVFFDDTLSAIRYAQTLAVATGCKVQVAINANGYTLQRPAAQNQCRSAAPTFNIAIPHPSTQQNSYSNTEAGVALTPNISFSFDALGRASSTVLLNVGGSHSITVVKETGFVYGS